MKEMKDIKDIKDMLKDGKSEQYIMEEYQKEFLKRLNDAKQTLAAEEKAEKEKKAKQEKQNKVRGELKEALCHYLAAKGNAFPSETADMWIKEIDKANLIEVEFMKYFM